MENKLIIVGGPTSSGKTSFAVNLAKELHGELISADSRQIYKFLNIGTNKGNLTGDNQKFIENIPIHLIDFLDLDNRFNVFEWRSLAISFIKNIQEKGKTPIVVGGTGLYIDSLLKDYNFASKFNISEDLKYLLKSMDINNLLVVQTHLKMHFKVVWDSLNFSDQNNLRRLQRLVQKLISDDAQVADDNFKVKDYVFYYPSYSWSDLKIRIDKRVDEMFDSGLIDETKSVLEKGYSKDCSGLQIMGYKEVVSYLDDVFSLDDCINRVKTVHKQYARRQRTWFEGERRGYKFELF